MITRPRNGSLGVLAACFGAAALALIPAAATSAAGTSAAAAQSTWVPTVTPFGHAQPSEQLPYPGPSGTASPWTPLANPPSFSPGTMLLQSDGSVLVHDEPGAGATTQWWRLTPNADGSYVDGTWSAAASMPTGYAPLYFASAVLPSGSMIVEGGEYNGTDRNGVWTNKGAIYNPISNTWKSVAPPSGWTNIGDAQSTLLASGTFMLAQACGNCTSGSPIASKLQALLNPFNLTWTSTGTGKADPNDEEAWTLEPSNKLLTVDAGNTPNTELFTPSTGAWSSAGNTATSPVNTNAYEIGPQVEMPGGNTFVVGGGTSAYTATCTVKTPAATALYHYGAGTIGTWSAGPNIPAIGGLQYDSADGPASILPSGNILFDVSPCVYLSPTHFMVYNAKANTLIQVPDPPNAPNDSTYYTRMLTLPTGQVLFDDGSNQMEVYTAGGSPLAAWAPSITSSPATVTPGDTYSLSGKQLAGLSQGAAYGDDVQDATNFPLVRITNTATGTVTYARTSHWSSVSIQSGVSSSTSFTVPASTPAGSSTLVAVANGIPSQPVAVTVG